MGYTYYAKVDIDEEIYCKNVKDLQDFEIFTINVNRRKKITAFKFKIEHDVIIDRNSDYLFIQDKIFYYLDFLSSISLCPTNKNHYKLTILDSTDNEIVIWEIYTLIPPRSDVEIDLSQYPNTLSNLSPERIENFRYYYAGVVFFVNTLYEFSIREFFKIIENDNSIKGYDDYKTIRDIFSHNRDKRSIASGIFLNSNLKNKFKHDISKDKKNRDIVIINRYHPNNVHSLLLMAQELKEIVERRVLLNLY